MAEKRTMTLVNTIAQEIIHYIIEHKMMPGDQLPTEAESLSRFQVSRNTLREAFKILVARNILEIRQGAGTFISYRRGIPDDPLGLTFIYDDNRLVLDMLEVRLMFEPRVAELAAVYATEEQKQAIGEQADELERCIHAGEPYAQADSCFHRLIAEGSGNRVIGNLTHILNSSVSKNIEITLDVQRENNTIYYHRKILKAIQEGNMNHAQYFMMMHLNLLREFVLGKIEREENS